MPPLLYAFLLCTIFLLPSKEDSWGAGQEGCLWVGSLLGAERPCWFGALSSREAWRPEQSLYSPALAFPICFWVTEDCREDCGNKWMHSSQSPAWAQWAFNRPCVLLRSSFSCWNVTFCVNKMCCSGWGVSAGVPPRVRLSSILSTNHTHIRTHTYIHIYTHTYIDKHNWRSCFTSIYLLNLR